MHAIRTLWASLRSSKGYTLDQTILIIAIIAILVTLIILTVGWNLINKASGTRLASQLGNVEDAMGNFYGDLKQWPVATTSNPVNDAVTLAGLNASSSGNTKNYIAGLATTATGVTHNLNTSTAANRRVTIGQVTGGTNSWVSASSSNIYEVVTFQSVYGSDFLEADRAIDSGDGGDKGRVRAIANAGATAPTATTGCYQTSALPTFIAAPTASTLYDVCYLANNVQ
ncbi:MAG TPA: hypothetical protein VHP58_02985 [Alphaproteobacteria bacterium]|nr:hypothetical protein [Alphaproteobacteria bacterium]